MNKALNEEHIEVLKTLFNTGLITRQAMKTIRGQVLIMKTHEEREEYLRKVIKNKGAKNKWANSM